MAVVPPLCPPTIAAPPTIVSPPCILLSQVPYTCIFVLQIFWGRNMPVWKKKPAHEKEEVVRGATYCSSWCTNFSSSGSAASAGGKELEDDESQYKDCKDIATSDWWLTYCPSCLDCWWYVLRQCMDTIYVLCIFINRIFMALRVGGPLARKKSLQKISLWYLRTGGTFRRKRFLEPWTLKCLIGNAFLKQNLWDLCTCLWAEEQTPQIILLFACLRIYCETFLGHGDNICLDAGH